MALSGKAAAEKKVDEIVDEVFARVAREDQEKEEEEEKKKEK